MARQPDAIELRLLQVPVKTAVAEKLAEFGARVSRNQSQFALLCLERALEDQTDFGNRLVSPVLRLIGAVLPQSRKLRKALSQDKRIVRIQVWVPEALAEHLEFFAAELNHSPVQAAGWLLERIIVEQDWLIRTVLNPLVLEVAHWLEGLASPQEKGPPQAAA